MWPGRRLTGGWGVSGLIQCSGQLELRKGLWILLKAQLNFRKLIRIYLTYILQMDEPLQCISLSTLRECWTLSQSKTHHNNAIIKDHYVRVIAFIDNPPFQHEPLAKRHRPDMEKILRTSLCLEIAEVPRRGTEMIWGKAEQIQNNVLYKLLSPFILWNFFTESYTERRNNTLWKVLCTP